MISISQMVSCGIAVPQANAFVDPFNQACDRFDITTKQRVAAFLGQCVIESEAFTRLEEDMNYSPSALVATFGYYHAHPDEAVVDGYDRDPVTRVFRRKADVQAIANKAYALRNGNGDIASGDGWTYRGRGLLQITGREEYIDAADGLAHDYVGHPELVALPPDACLTAGWYWHCNKLNALADAMAIDAITKAVNGPRMLKAVERKQMTQQALRVLNV